MGIYCFFVAPNKVLQSAYSSEKEQVLESHYSATDWFAPLCPTLPVGFAEVGHDVSEMVSEYVFTQTWIAGLQILKILVKMLL